MTRMLFGMVIVAAVVLPQGGSRGAVPFGDKGWVLEGEGTRITREGGREVLHITSGFAHRRDVRLMDGTIDFDVQVTRRRSFVYVNFRVEGEGEHEEFYLRPHKSGLPDALQYAPVWQDRSAWQLHHGPGRTAAFDFQPDVWTPVRVVLKGEHAALFIGDLDRPALLVPKLSRTPRAGSIGLGSFVPAGTPGSDPAARFANVRVSQDPPSFDFASAISAAASIAPSAPPASGTIVPAWSVSRAFVPPQPSGTSLPGPDVAGDFQRLETEPGGLLQMYRHLRAPEGSRVAAAVARIRLRSTRGTSCAFDLGFSDIATVFVNGRPLAQIDASYSFDRPRREGLIGFDQVRLYLPLIQGENELAVLLTDSFGGWGVMGRLAACEGVTIAE